MIGCYHLLGASQIRTHGRLLVCEGFSTGAIIHELTHHPVIIDKHIRYFANLLWERLINFIQD